jgi:hypothetical protein
MLIIEAPIDMPVVAGEIDEGIAAEIEIVEIHQRRKDEEKEEDDRSPRRRRRPSG